MGNIQGGENKPSKGKVKTLIKIRGKKGTKEEVHFVPVVNEDENDTQVSHRNDEIVDKEKIDKDETPKVQKKNVVTDSWCKVNKINDGNVNRNKIISPGGESSSDSIFTDPQTPVGFSAEINECYYSEENVNDSNLESYINNLTLNNFKLNEYRVRREKDLTRKLSKLGLSKTSQISLDGGNESNFVSDNVEVVNKVGDSTSNDNITDDSKKSYASNHDIAHSDSFTGKL